MMMILARGKITLLILLQGVVSSTTANQLGVRETKPGARALH